MILRIALASAGLSLAFLAVPSAPAMAQDAAAGEAVFKKGCMTCHRIGPGAKNAVGPVLNGVYGRPAGTSPNYAYSALNKAAGSAGLVWNDDTLFAYLPDPRAFLVEFLKKEGKDKDAKGTTKMAFKLPGEKERKAVIEFLKSHQDTK